MNREKAKRRRLRTSKLFGQRSLARQNWQRTCTFELCEDRRVLAGDIVISEFVANNETTLLDEDGDKSDWIELLNAGVEPVNLLDWHLTDDATDLDKWTLPGVTLAPGDTIVVFASNKDRDNPTRPLHTNFRLDNGGEYLALTRPDATVVDQYAPAYPPQVVDVAYGVPVELTRQVLVAEGAVGHLYVPTDSAMDPANLSQNEISGSWLDPTLVAPEPAWSSVKTGIGFHNPDDDPTPQPGAGTLLADSVSEFSVFQNRNNWRYGYWDESADADGVYSSATDFKAFSWTGLTTVSQFNHWDGTKWDLAAGGAPTTELSATGGVPAGATNSGVNQQVVRRWTSELTGSILVSGELANEVGGDGVVVEVRIEGQSVYRRSITDSAVNYRFVTAVKVGDRVDFMISAGPNHDDVADGTRFTARIEDVTSIVGDQGGGPSLTDVIKTDIAAQVKGISASAYLRIPFELPSIAFDALTLNMRYDDGFIAYLNGHPIASAGIADPNSAAWNSHAATSRTVTEAVTTQIFDVTQAKDLLLAGTTNVLMIHALNVSATDGDLLALPELVGTRLQIDLAKRQYFTVPTPNAENGFGDSAVGPLLLRHNHQPRSPKTDEPLLVTVDVAKSFHDVAQVNLIYRVMYNASKTIAMRDDGTNGDVAAGDGVYAARLPAGIARPGEMIRWYFTARDAQNQQSRLPRFDDALDSEEYFGTIVADPSVQSNLPVIHWFVANRNAAMSNSGTRGSIYYDGEFYDNVRFDLHGQSTSGFSTAKKSMNVDFTRDHRFRWLDGIPRMKDINLLTNYPDKSKLRNTLAYEQRRIMGDAYHLAYPVRVQYNGAFFAVYDFVEDGDDRWLDRMGLDPNGALYKMYNTMNAATGEKKTRRDEGTTDLQALVSGIQQTGANRNRYLFDNINLPAMVNYLAGFVITSNQDCCHKNYYAYRDTQGTGEWWYMPWDVDLTQGRNWGGFGLAYFDDTMYPNNALYMGRNNVLISALYNLPGFKDMYLRRVRSMIDQYVKPPGTPASELPLERRVDELVTLMAADAALDNQANRATWGQTGYQTFEQATRILKEQYAGPRRQWLYGTQLTTTGGPIPLAQQGNPRIEFGQIEFNPTSGNQDEEFIELKNPNSYAVDLSNWKVDGAIDMTLPSGTVLPAGWSLYLTPNAQAFRARAAGPRGGQQLFVVGNYGGHLSNFGETLTLLGADGSIVQTRTYEGDPTDAQKFLAITELMYNPLEPDAREHTLNAAWTGQDFEFVELQNTSIDKTLDLRGVQFSEGIQFDFTGSPVMSLAPGETVLVVRNEAAFLARYGDRLAARVAGTFQLSGGLSNDGETIKLEDGTGSTIMDFAYSDDVDRGWAGRADGRGSSLELVAAGAVPADGLSWIASPQVNGSPGGTSIAPGPLLRINEVATRPVGGVADWVELLNVSDSVVSLSAFYLAAEAAAPDALLLHSLPETQISAGARQILDLGKLARPLDLDGRAATTLYLLRQDNDGRVWFVDELPLSATDPGETYGRPEGSLFGARLQRVTPGEGNGIRALGPVLISEVQYHPSEVPTAVLAIEPTLSRGDLEFVELTNVGSERLSLAGWKLHGDVDLLFADDAAIPAGTSMIVVSFNPGRANNQSRVAAFRSAYGLGLNTLLVGGYSGQLNDSGDRVTLSRPGIADDGSTDANIRVVVDEVRFDDVEPWPVEADGLGPTLQRIDARRVGNDAAAWSALASTAGHFATPTELRGDINQDGQLTVDDLNAWAAAYRAGSQDLRFDVNQDRRVGTDDRDALIFVEFNTSYGDANLDGLFNTSDLVSVFARGHYEDEVAGNSQWQDGDWDGDGEFSTSDLVVAFAAGGYEQPPASRASWVDAVFATTKLRRAGTAFLA